METWIAQAIDKGTGFFKTSTICSTKQGALKNAKYYRSIGYNSKVYNEHDYITALDNNYDEHYNQIQLQQTNF